MKTPTPAPLAEQAEELIQGRAWVPLAEWARCPAIDITPERARQQFHDGSLPVHAERWHDGPKAHIWVHADSIRRHLTGAPPLVESPTRLSIVVEIGTDGATVVDTTPLPPAA